MKLTSAIQEALLCIVCYDGTPGGSTLARALVEAKRYDTYYRDIAEEVESYIQQFEQVPGEHLLDIIDTLSKREPEKAEIYLQILVSMEQTKNDLNREYVLSRANAFAKHQRLKRGMAEAIEVIQSGESEDVDEAEAILHRTLGESHKTFDAGTFITDTDRGLRFLDEDYSAFPTGIKELDDLSLGPARKRLHVFGAQSGRGKSWWLVNLAKAALLGRKKVLYITLELSETEVAQRIYQALFAISKRDAPVMSRRFQTDNGRFAGIEEKELKKLLNFKQHDIRAKVRKKVQPLTKRPPILVKEFPTGSLTIRDLEAYLDSLEGGEGFIPDLVLVDYADLMYVDPAALRVGLGVLYKDLRGLGMKRNIAMATVTQLNRSAPPGGVSTGLHVAEDYSKIATADYFLTYNQTAAEHALGLARLFQDKGRTEKDKFTVLISQAYEIGQFCIDSTKMSTTYWDDMREFEDD